MRSILEVTKGGKNTKSPQIIGTEHLGLLRLQILWINILWGMTVANLKHPLANINHLLSG